MNKTFDRYASIVFLVLGISLFFYSQTMKASVGSVVGPEILPLFFSVALIILSIINLVASIRSKAENKKGEKLEYKKFFIILISTIIYSLLIEPLGYVITTFAFLMVTFQTMERGKYIQSAIIAAAMSFGVYYLYVEVAKGSLPGLPSFLGF
ncbi:MAG: tripartite tricarboxylate transporter TctB family protein [Peptococcaceae bacterium]|nr:tripartite tricarboxylate transporter TctB family protein [Peptococcaceae bacterium]